MSIRKPILTIAAALAIATSSGCAKSPEAMQQDSYMAAIRNSSFAAFYVDFISTGATGAYSIVKASAIGGASGKDTMLCNLNEAYGDLPPIRVSVLGYENDKIYIVPPRDALKLMNMASHQHQYIQGNIFASCKR